MVWFDYTKEKKIVLLIWLEFEENTIDMIQFMSELS